MLFSSGMAAITGATSVAMGVASVLVVAYSCYHYAHQAHRIVVVVRLGLGCGLALLNVCLAWLLYRSFGWAAYERVGAEPHRLGEYVAGMGGEGQACVGVFLAFILRTGPHGQGLATLIACPRSVQLQPYFGRTRFSCLS